MGRVVIVDDAGVLNVESRAPTWDKGAAAWLVSEMPILEIGGDDEELKARLGTVSGARRLDDGRIVVSGRSHIMWFDKDGEFLFERGGSGNGPGEYPRVITKLLFWPPDTIGAVYHPSRQRRHIVIYDGEGRQTGEPVAVDGPAAAGFERLPDGRWVHWGATQPGVAIDAGPSVPGYYRPRMPLVIVSSDGATVDTVGQFAGALRSLDTDEPLTLAPFASFAVDNNRIVVGNAIEHQLSMINSDGSVVRRYRWRGEDLGVPESEHEAWRTGLLETAYTSPGQDPSFLQNWVAGLKFAQMKSAYIELRTDPAENIWAQRYLPANVPHVYTVLSADGAWLGDVTMPAGFSLAQVGQDFVLGIWKDSMDVDYVRVYALTKK